MLFLKLATALFALAPSARRRHHQIGITRHLSTTSTDGTSSATNTTPQKYQDLLAWIQKQPGAEINDKIVIQESSRGGGFGAAVAANVAKDELLFCIPRTACVTLKNVKDDAQCGEAFQKLMEKSGPGGNTVCMAGLLAKEYLVSMQQDNNDSQRDTKWEPYLATLPWKRGINNQEHVLYWSEEDVESFLKGSLSYQEAKDLRGEVDLAIRVLNGIIGPCIRESRGENIESGFSWPWESKPQTGLVEGLPEAVSGAFVSLLTRSFQDGETGDEEKLVPLLDMLQHSDEPNVRHVMKKEDGTVEVRARCDIAAGEELMNQYRSEEEENMPYHRFFTRYGFVPGITEPIPNLLKDRSPIFYSQKAEV